MRNRLRPKADLHEKKKSSDVMLNGTRAREPVTDGDLLSHRAMHLGMAEQFPGINIVSEEKDTNKYGTTQNVNM